MISSAFSKSPVLSHSTDGTRQRRLDANTDRSVRRTEEPQSFSRTPEGNGFNSHPGQSFSLSLCGPISISRANAHMVHMGLKSSTSHYTLFS